MKLKYYLRGMGIGIIVTTIILAISFSQREVEISDEQVMARAEALGMVMPEEETKQTEQVTATELLAEETKPTGSGEEMVFETETGIPEEATTETETETETEMAETEIAETETELQQETETETERMETKVAETEETEDETTETEATEKTDKIGTNGKKQTGTYRLVIKKGDVCRVICETLQENGVIDDAEALRKHLFELGYANSISTGSYNVPYGLSMEEVAQIIVAGPVE